MSPTDTTYCDSRDPGWVYTCASMSGCTSNAVSTSWLSHSVVPWAAPVLKLRLGKWQTSEERRSLDIKGSREALRQHARHARHSKNLA